MIPLQWTPVSSSKIAAAKFEPNEFDDRGILYIEFTTGQVYRYEDVPGVDVERMLHSSSPGSYFHEYIRGNYDTARES